MGEPSFRTSAEADVHRQKTVVKVIRLPPRRAQRRRARRARRPVAAPESGSGWFSSRPTDDRSCERRLRGQERPRGDALNPRRLGVTN